MMELEQDILEKARRRNPIPVSFCEAFKTLARVEYDLTSLSEAEQTAGLAFLMASWPAQPAYAIRDEIGGYYFCSRLPGDVAFFEAKTDSDKVVSGPYLPYVGRAWPGSVHDKTVYERERVTLART
ncbi:MAG: hypothetical protein ACK4I8_12095, partial [Armatimonadota bacterium]